MSHNSWYVITGGPSSGKTTLLTELGKLGHTTIPEAARTIIDEAVAKGISVQELRADERRFQNDIARLKEKIEAAHDTTVLTFFDRGMHDTIAYMRHYGFEIEDWTTKLMEKTRYQKVFLLDPLPMYRGDYARTEDSGFAKTIHKLLHDVYTEFGMEPLRVPAMSVKDRAMFILDNVKVEQTA